MNCPCFVDHLTSICSDYDAMTEHCYCASEAVLEFSDTSLS